MQINFAAISIGFSGRKGTLSLLNREYFIIRKKMIKKGSDNIYISIKTWYLLVDFNLAMSMVLKSKHIIAHFIFARQVFNSLFSLYFILDKPLNCTTKHENTISIMLFPVLRIIIVQSFMLTEKNILELQLFNFNKQKNKL